MIAPKTIAWLSILLLSFCLEGHAQEAPASSPTEQPVSKQALPPGNNDSKAAAPPKKRYDPRDLCITKEDA